MRASLWLLIAAVAAPALAQPAGSELSAPPSMSLDAAPGPVMAGQKVRLALTDGQTLNCELLGEEADRITVRIGSGAPFDISRTTIRTIESADAPPSPRTWFRDPNITRHFYAPTGFMLRKGEGYFSQKELVFSSFGYGVTDNVSVMVGSVVPTWFMPSGQNLAGGFKFGASVNDTWHLAAGAQGVVLPFTSFNSGGLPSGFALVFGTATVGVPDFHLTVSLGEGLGNVSPFSNAVTIVALGGSLRLGPNVALETEHWFFPTISVGNAEPFLMFNSAGVRLMSENLAADLGLIRFPGSPVPIPWLDFTYTFGN